MATSTATTTALAPAQRTTGSVDDIINTATLMNDEIVNCDGRARSCVFENDAQSNHLRHAVRNASSVMIQQQQQHKKQQQHKQQQQQLQHLRAARPNKMAANLDYVAKQCFTMVNGGKIPEIGERQEIQEIVGSNSFHAPETEDENDDSSLPVVEEDEVVRVEVEEQRGRINVEQESSRVVPRRLDVPCCRASVVGGTGSRLSPLGLVRIVCVTALLIFPVTRAAELDSENKLSVKFKNDIRSTVISKTSSSLSSSSTSSSSSLSSSSLLSSSLLSSGSSPLDSVSPTSIFASSFSDGIDNGENDKDDDNGSSKSSHLTSLSSPKLSSIPSPTSLSSSSSSPSKTPLTKNLKFQDTPSLLPTILSPSLSPQPQPQPQPSSFKQPQNNLPLLKQNQPQPSNLKTPTQPSPTLPQQPRPPQQLKSQSPLQQPSPPSPPQQPQQPSPPSSPSSPTQLPTTLKLGLIIPHKNFKFFDYREVTAALDIAKQKVLNTEYLLPWVKHIEVNSRDSQCSPTYGPLSAIDLYANKSAHVFFGPHCGFAATPVVKYNNQWNIPVVTPGAAEFLLRHRKQYKLLTRVDVIYSKVTPLFTTIFKKFGWNHIGFFYHFNRTVADPCYMITYGVFKDLRSRLSSAPPQIPFNENNPQDMNKIESNMKILTSESNIIVLCASADSVREIMIKAHDLNFDNGEYVFFSIDLFSSNDATSKPWHRDDDTVERNEKARKAYEALMMVTLRKPTSAEYRNFSNQVKERAKLMYENMTYEEQDVNSFVGAFHDAVILYAYALNETIASGGNISDGIAITRKMWNRTINGITGTVSIDDNGDRNADYSLLDLNPKTERFEVVADYIGQKQEYQAVEGRQIHWAGGRDGPPPDVPKCGFDGSLCPPSKPFPLYGIVIIVLGSILLVVFVVILLAWRHIKLQSELSEQNWRVKWDDIMQAGSSTKNRRDSHDSNCSGDTIAVHLMDGGNRQLFTKTGYYKGAILAIKPIYRTHFAMQRSTLMEIKKMKDLQNDHLVRFQGICIDPPHQCMLTEYCPKGSLQDVLENEQLKLDWMFRYSIMQDIVRGMAYLHSTDIKSHGHLKSSNCVVDSRFVVKITDFGLHYFREKEEELEEVTYARDRSLLWTAPELLRMAEPPAAGTQKADVYSFAIICQEIVYRNGAFYIQNMEFSPREITERVRNGQRPPCRPTMEEYDCPEDELAGLIRRCWSEEPAERPDFQNLRTLIKKMNKEGDKGDILDNLLSRMEQYATNLEALVDERTSDYLNEKKKAEELLYNMLPRQVASRLIQGLGISAEWYDEVTIYFSDICGFTALSAESTPMQVVDLLNDLYTCFDSILENFDVYKVETIGDAYMVVSGLPVKNGNLHAREIARMSLCLLDNVFRFKIRHRPDIQLKLRIGMHSGPVCAGVVGLKMPRYCLFGDTVNTSSRMESNGLALRIHVSPFTKEYLDNFSTFQLEKRGAVEMKGKGAITTYWLLGEEGSPYNIRQHGYNEPSPAATEPPL